MRLLATFAASFAAGIFLAQYVLPNSWLLPCAVVCFVLACLRIVLPNNTGRRLLLIGVGLSFALGWNWLYVRQVQAPMEALADTQQTMTLTLCDYAVPTDYGAKVTARAEGLPGKIVYYGDETLLRRVPGQTIETAVYLQSASRIRDDDVTTFTSKGVFLLAYQRGEETCGTGSMHSPRWWPVRVGRAMQEQIQTLFSGDTAAFLTAILTGNRTGLSTQGITDLEEAGLFHVLAVSGMHCGFLLAMVFVLVGRHRRRLVAAVTLPLLGFYALLTGGTPSVVRACVMLAFLLAAPLFHRDSDGPTALTAALLLILLKNPFAAASISLQLSFGAMAGILWLTPRLSRLLLGRKNRGKVYHFTAVGFSTTMGALVFTAPLSAYYFRFLVLVSPLSNLLCLWAASLVFIFGLAAVLLGFLWIPLGIAVGFLPRMLTAYILGVAHILAKIPYHAVYYANPYLKYWLAFAYLLFVAAWLLKPKGKRKYAVAALLAAVMLAVTVHLGAARYDSALDTMILDVGQGQSVVLASDRAFALVDCGSGNSWIAAGGIAADQLMSMGCRELDYLILTHYDSDHVNGVAKLLARLRVKTLLLPEEADENGLQAEVLALAETYGVSVDFVRQQKDITLGCAALTVFPPVGTKEDNEQGLSVLANAGEEKLLITGDMDIATEKKLLAEFRLPDLDVLVAGHHGSKNATSEELLEELAPEVVCISVGSNSYGHPAEDALRRIALQDCTAYRTDMHGRIYLPMN